MTSYGFTFGQLFVLIGANNDQIYIYIYIYDFLWTR